MKIIRITDEDGVVNEFDACDVTVEEIDVPEVFKPVKGADEDEGYYNIIQTRQGWDWDPVVARASGIIPRIMNRFHAQNYAEAKNVLFELWACDGVVEVQDEDQYYIDGDLEIIRYFSKDMKLGRLSPVYKTSTHAAAAIHKVGPERIKKMFRSFKFIK